MPISKSTNFIIPGAQYCLKIGDTITMANEEPEDSKYLLTGFIPQDIRFMFTEEDRGYFLNNTGQLPITLFNVDNPYRMKKVERTDVLPGEKIHIPSGRGDDNQYVCFLAYALSCTTGDGKLFPTAVKMEISCGSSVTLCFKIV